MKSKISDVLYYTIDNNDYWIYSLKNIEDNFYKYYLLSMEDNNPTITDITNPIDFLQKLNITPVEIYENSMEYIRFLAIKNIAEKKLLNVIKR
ncbi:MAG: hypothetical protein IJ572_01285 [Bacilli bacterium]|nr:hypothetical protein [Bacilli bacterium]